MCESERRKYLRISSENVLWNSYESWKNNVYRSRVTKDPTYFLEVLYSSYKERATNKLGLHWQHEVCSKLMNCPHSEKNKKTEHTDSKYLHKWRGKECSSKKISHSELVIDSAVGIWGNHAYVNKPILNLFSWSNSQIFLQTVYGLTVWFIRGFCSRVLWYMNKQITKMTGTWLEIIWQGTTFNTKLKSRKHRSFT